MHEVGGAHEADEAGHDEQPRAEEVHVEEVRESADEGDDLEFGDKIVEAVKPNIQGAGTAGQKRAPPEAVVLVAKLEVCQNNGELRAHQREHDEHQEQEAEDVVELVEPQRAENEKQFHKDHSEREDSAHKNGDEGGEVPLRRGDLGRNADNCRRRFDLITLVTHVGPDERERERDTQPHGHDGEHGAERDRTRGMYSPATHNIRR